jgi:hypothetical protein
MENHSNICFLLQENEINESEKHENFIFVDLLLLFYILAYIHFLNIAHFATFNPPKPKFVLIIFKHSVRTLKRTQQVSITKINWLLLFGKIIAVYSERDTKPINTLCGKNQIYRPLKVVVHIVTTGL